MDLVRRAALLPLIAAAPGVATGCDRLKEAADRAATRLDLRDPCPDPVEGRAAGAATAETAVACFRQAMRERRADLLLRVTCRGRSPASCAHGEGTAREADAVVARLGRLDWSAVLGRWNEGDGSRAVVYAFDTQPGEARVTTIGVCRIVPGAPGEAAAAGARAASREGEPAPRWAVCEVGEAARDAAERKTRGTGR